MSWEEATAKVKGERLSRSELQAHHGYNRHIRTAVHEAGHALFTFYAGGYVKWAYITARNGGLCEWTDKHAVDVALLPLIERAGVVAEWLWMERHESLYAQEHAVFELSTSLDSALFFESESCAEYAVSKEQWATLEAFFTRHYDEVVALGRLIYRRWKHPRKGDSIYSEDIQAITGKNLFTDIRPNLRRDGTVA